MGLKPDREIFIQKLYCVRKPTCFIGGGKHRKDTGMYWNQKLEDVCLKGASKKEQSAMNHFTSLVLFIIGHKVNFKSTRECNTVSRTYFRRDKTVIYTFAISIFSQFNIFHSQTIALKLTSYHVDLGHKMAWNIEMCGFNSVWASENNFVLFILEPPKLKFGAI